MRVVLISGTLYSCSQTMAWEHFSSMCLISAGQEYSSDSAFIVQEAAMHLQTVGMDLYELALNLLGSLTLGYYAGQCFHNHKAIISFVWAQNKTCKIHSR